MSEASSEKQKTARDILEELVDSLLDGFLRGRPCNDELSKRGQNASMTALAHAKHIS
jgi:hypothetical protein